MSGCGCADCGSEAGAVAGVDAHVDPEVAEGIEVVGALVAGEGVLVGHGHGVDDEVGLFGGVLEAFQE